MKNAKIRELLAQMTALEEQLAAALREQESKMVFRINGKRVELEQTVQQAGDRFRSGLLHWMISNRPWNLITFPVIYGMVIPLVLMDISVTLYQLLCFPVYGVAKVKRGNYIVLDRHRLEYLNFFQRLHCNYCGYATGLIAYIAEIVARTEQYFCPIKHAHKLLGAHGRYSRFLEFGDAEQYEAKLEAYRVELGKEAPIVDEPKL